MNRALFVYIVCWHGRVTGVASHDRGDNCRYGTRVFEKGLGRRRDTRPLEKIKEEKHFAWLKVKVKVMKFAVPFSWFVRTVRFITTSSVEETSPYNESWVVLSSSFDLIASCTANTILRRT